MFFYVSYGGREPHPTLAGGIFQANQLIIWFIECEQ